MGKRLRLVLMALVVALATAELILQCGYCAVWLLQRQDSVAAAASGDRVVLCVGDSFTYGMGASAAGQSYPAQLENLLRSGGGQCRVENRGWPGRNSREVLEALDGLLVALKPQVVCITVGVNDGWSHPERYQLPAAPPSAAAAAERRYVWAFRTWRLLQTFRSRDPFRDQLSGQPTGDSRQPDADLVGSWRLHGSGLRLALASGGKGDLGGSTFAWSVEGQRIRVLAAGWLVEGDWRLEDDDLVLCIAGGELRCGRDAPEGQPADPVMAGYRAIKAAQWAEALRAFRRSLAGNPPGVPGPPHVHAALVRCLLALGRPDEAARELAIVRQLAEDKSDVFAREALSTALLATGEEKASDEIVAELIAAGVQTPGLWVRQAQMAENRGDMVGARQAIDRAIELAILKKWTDISYHYRTKARLWRSTAEFDTFAGAAIDGHLQDGDRAATRQLLLGWGAPREAKFAAMERACHQRQLPAAEAKVMMDLLRESLGEGQEAWQTTLIDHLRQAIRRCREAGAAPVLGTYPFRFGCRQQLQDLATAEGVPFVANDVVFAAIRDQEPGRVLTVADGHCNDDGYGVMAQGFAAAIRKLWEAGGR